MSGIRERISRVALAAALVAGATLMSAPEAFAKKDSELPTLNPNDELTDTKLTPAVAKILADAITDLNAHNFNDAGAQIRQARVVPGLTTYDTFQIDNLTILLAEGTKDAVLGFAAVEEMVQSSALTDKDHHAVYANGLLFAAAKKDYWRAI